MALSMEKGARIEKSRRHILDDDGTRNGAKAVQGAQKQKRKQSKKDRVEDGPKIPGPVEPEGSAQDLQGSQQKMKNKRDRALLFATQIEDALGQHTREDEGVTPMLESASQDAEMQPRKKKMRKDRGLPPARQVDGGVGQHSPLEDAATPLLERAPQDAQSQPEMRKKKKKKERGQLLAGQVDNNSGRSAMKEEASSPELETHVPDAEQPQKERKKKKDRRLLPAGQVEDVSGQHTHREQAASPELDTPALDVQEQLQKKRKRMEKDRAGGCKDDLDEDMQDPGDTVHEVGTTEQVAKRKKKRKEKEVSPESQHESKLELHPVHQNGAAQNGEEVVPDGQKKKRKRRKILETEDTDQGAVPMKEVAVPDTAPLKKKKGKGSQVVILSGNRAESWKDDNARTDLKYGAFSKEEDERLRAAIAEYIEEKQLGDDGVEKLFNIRNHKGLRGAWLEIGRCLPDRSIRRVHARAERLLHDGNYKGHWSPEEEAMLRSLYAQIGPKWTQLGRSIGRMPEACKVKWRILRVTDKREGRWSPEESQKLARLVQESLAEKKIRASVERVIDGRQVRDDIDWTPISDRMGNRTPNQCLRHWYSVLAPRTIRTTAADIEEWGGEDDRTMLQRILESGATSEVDVEWGSLLPDRDGGTCRKRWRMMVKHLPSGGSFEDSVSKLCERYAPDLMLEGV